MRSVPIDQCSNDRLFLVSIVVDSNQIDFHFILIVLFLSKHSLRVVIYLIHRLADRFTCFAVLSIKANIFMAVVDLRRPFCSHTMCVRNKSHIHFSANLSVGLSVSPQFVSFVTNTAINISTIYCRLLFVKNRLKIANIFSLSHFMIYNRFFANMG